MYLSCRGYPKRRRKLRHSFLTMYRVLLASVIRRVPANRTGGEPVVPGPGPAQATVGRLSNVSNSIFGLE